MIKQLIIPLVAVAVFVIIVGLFSQRASSLNLGKYLPASTPSSTEAMTVGSKTIRVDIANTSDLRARGLSGRNYLASDAGMLFVFESKNVSPNFWMKDMLIPLDMVWISEAKIIKIDSKVPAPSPGTPDNKLNIFSSTKPVDYVLEVNSGFAAENGIKVGDAVTLPTL